MSDNDKPESLLKFPCDFTIKVFGTNTEDFESIVKDLIAKHLGSKMIDIKPRQSENGKYLALSVTLPVESQVQLDAIYQELSGSKSILMVL